MISVIIIEKSGNIINKNIKNFDIKTLYKCCKLRKETSKFCKRHTWKIDNSTFISAYCKNNGKAGTENKYELPQPIDKELFFSNIVLVKHTDSEIENENCDDLTIEEWEKIYEKLMGGFENLNEEDSFSEEEEIPDELKTQNGYMKDGFVVDDDEEIEYEEIKSDDSLNDNLDYDEEDDEDDEEEDDEDDEEEDDEEEDDEEEDYETEDDYSSGGSELEEEEDTEEEDEEEDEEEEDEDEHEEEEDDDDSEPHK